MYNKKCFLFVLLKLSEMSKYLRRIETTLHISNVEAVNHGFVSVFNPWEVYKENSQYFKVK